MKQLSSSKNKANTSVKIKQFLVLFSFVLISAFAFAQSNFQDVVYLKNGSIIRGIIIEQRPNQSIKIETADRSVFVYQMDEIEKLTKEPFRGQSNNKSANLKSGYKGIIEAGYQFKVGNFGMDRVHLNIINGYQVNPYFSFGFGTGLRYYLDAEAILIPVFVHFRTSFIDKIVSPYLSLGVGYSFDATNDFNGVGFLLNPAIGVRFKVSGKTALHVGVGYEMQRMKFFYYDGYYLFDAFTENSGAISLVLGISF